MHLGTVAIIPLPSFPSHEDNHPAPVTKNAFYQFLSMMKLNTKQNTGQDLPFRGHCWSRNGRIGMGHLSCTARESTYNLGFWNPALRWCLSHVGWLLQSTLQTQSQISPEVCLFWNCQSILTKKCENRMRKAVGSTKEVNWAVLKGDSRVFWKNNAPSVLFT